MNSAEYRSAGAPHPHLPYSDKRSLRLAVGGLDALLILGVIALALWGYTRDQEDRDN